MISPDDIADILYGVLRGLEPENLRTLIRKEDERRGKRGPFTGPDFNRPYTSLPAKRIFLSEYEIKRMLKPGRTELELPKAAIVSPLAEEWLASRGVRVVRI